MVDSGRKKTENVIRSYLQIELAVEPESGTCLSPLSALSAPERVLLSVASL